MKLVRFGAIGSERPGLVDTTGVLRELSAHIPDIGPAQLAPSALAALRKIEPGSLPVVKGNPRLGTPIVGTQKFLGIGLNYRDHAAESGLAIPEEPVLFAKATSSLSGPDDPIIIPRRSEKTDWEVELGVVIGSRARYVSRAEALECVAGYCLVNDVSERDYQFNRSGTGKGKGYDTFGPVGPWLVTRDEIADPQNLSLWLDLNGKRMQVGNTMSMVFGVAEIVSHVSEFMTLEPGDIIATGTPPGVGMGIKPQPVFLRPGDVVRLGIEGLGEQEHKVVASC